MKTTKNARYVRSLGKKSQFGAYTEARKGVGRGQVRSKGSPDAQKNANPSVLSKKNVSCIESLIFKVRWKFHVWEGLGGSPQKSAHFGATAPA